jgi:hypothetical protein
MSENDLSAGESSGAGQMSVGITFRGKLGCKYQCFFHGTSFVGFSTLIVGGEFRICQIIIVIFVLYQFC